MEEKVALLFPGSGSQYVGMAHTLYKQYPIVRQTFQEVDDYLGYKLSKICFEGGITKLNKIQNMLLAIYTTSVAFFHVFQEESGIFPTYSAGHSLGEYSALTCSGVLSFSDGIRIIKRRCQIADEVAREQKGCMSIIKNTTVSAISRACASFNSDGMIATVACYNSPTQFLISGNEKAIMEVEKKLISEYDDVQVAPIVGGAPYHSPLMKKKAEEFKDELTQYTLEDFNWPVVSNVDSVPYQSKDEVVDKLVRQLYNPVLWIDTISYLCKKNVTTVFEVGPQSILKNLTKENTDLLSAFSIDDKTDRKRIFSSMSDNQLEGAAHISRLQAIKLCLTHAVSTRNNRADTEDYDHKVISLYEKIMKDKNMFEAKRDLPTEEHVIQSLIMLNEVFNAKRTPESERNMRIQQILDKTGIVDIYAKCHFIRSKNDC